MPKRMMSGGGLGETFDDLLPGWQATGLALAAVSGHVLVGSGAVVFAVLAVGLIWALHRLHVNAPAARSTADLIGSVLGTAPARAAGVVQYAAYLLLGAFTVSSVALLTLSWSVDSDPATTGWLWPATAVATAGIAGAFVTMLPLRALAALVTVLAGFGLLVYFYLGLAVLAKVYSGTEPIEIGPAATSSKFGAIGIILVLAMSMVAFEIPTTASDRLRSVARPLGWAMALMVVAAGTAWAATNVGVSGDFRFDATDLVYVAAEMFGHSSGVWVVAATTALASAALIMLTFGAARAAPAPLPSDEPGVLVATVITALLAVVMCRGWGDVSSKLWGVAGILLLVVYLLVVQANSRLEDGNTMAWGLFALVGVVLLVVVFVIGAGTSWWPVGIAAAIAAVAATVAVASRQSGNPNSLTTP